MDRQIEKGPVAANDEPPRKQTTAPSVFNANGLWFQLVMLERLFAEQRAEISLRLSKRPPRWRELTPIEQSDWLDTLFGEAAPAPNEIVFLRTVRAHLRDGQPLSRAQREAIDTILLSAWKKGVRL